MPDTDHHLQNFARRTFLKGAGLGVGAFALPCMMQAQAASEFAPRAKSVIVLFLQGGISHFESWDMKPHAPSEVRGDFNPISTSVPGTQICEHMPLLAQRAHKYSIIRSTWHGTPSHEAAIHWVLTGYDFPGANTTTKNRADKPAMGSIVAKLRGSGNSGLPSYVCVPDRGQLGDRVRYGGASYLGLAYDPFESGLTPDDAYSPFQTPPNLSLAKGVDLTRMQDRLGLLRDLDQLPRAADSSGLMQGMDGFNLRAYELLLKDKTRAAFDLAHEPKELRERYGSNRIGQRLILARRLAEAGVPFTLVNSLFNQEWDTHKDNFNSMKKTLLPMFDRGVSALLDDLEARGLLDTTLVAVLTEFGRTPRINKDAGRDHWSDVFSVMLAGGGIKPGQVIGSSNTLGERPGDRPVHIHDVQATIYQQLGVRTDEVFRDTLGRPFSVLEAGQPLPELA